jgi:hypothetical protein
MSKSPHRFRGDAAESWRAVLFGEIVRGLDVPLAVRDEATIKLPNSGHWESGLARLRPALDDALGSTAFAVAWRWACVETQANAWPGLPLIARKATDRAVTAEAMAPLATHGHLTIQEGAGARAWRLRLPDGSESVVGVSGTSPRDWGEVDRVAHVLAAWLDADWSIQQA